MCLAKYIYDQLNAMKKYKFAWNIIDCARYFCWYKSQEKKFHSNSFLIDRKNILILLFQLWSVFKNRERIAEIDWNMDPETSKFHNLNFEHIVLIERKQWIRLYLDLSCSPISCILLFKLWSSFKHGNLRKNQSKLTVFNFI